MKSGRAGRVVGAAKASKGGSVIRRSASKNTTKGVSTRRSTGGVGDTARGRSTSGRRTTSGRTPIKATSRRMPATARRGRSTH